MTTRSSAYNPKALEKYSNDLMGQIYPPDDQCEAQFGNGSFLCRVRSLCITCIVNSEIIFTNSIKRHFCDLKSATRV